MARHRVQCCSFSGCFRCSHCWQALPGVQLLAVGFASTAIRHPEQQEGREPFIHKIHQLAELRYRSSFFLVLWGQELTRVPWSPDIHPTLGRKSRSITTPWQCFCDPLRTAPVLNALLPSFNIDCGQEKFVRRALSSPWEQKTEGE